MTGECSLVGVGSMVICCLSLAFSVLVIALTVLKIKEMNSEKL